VELLNVPDVSEALGVEVTRIRQYIRERKLLAIRIDGVLKIPALFISGDEIVKGLPGLLMLLADQGFSDEETLTWLFADDDSLPGSPIQALQENRATEVKRRAQSLGF
jgi:Rv2175c C-terminal domain of unknown function